MSYLCENLIHVTTTNQKDRRHSNSKDLDLLNPLSDAILISSNPNHNTAAMGSEIRMVLDKISTEREE